MNFRRFIPESLQDVEIIKLVLELLEKFIKSDIEVIGKRTFDEDIQEHLRTQNAQVENYYLQTFGSKGFYKVLGYLTDPEFQVREWYEVEDEIDRCCIVIQANKTGKREEELNEFIESAWKSLRHLCLRSYLIKVILEFIDIVKDFKLGDNLSFHSDNHYKDSIFNSFAGCSSGSIVNHFTVGHSLIKSCNLSNLIGHIIVNRFFVGDYHLPPSISDRFTVYSQENFSEKISSDLNSSYLIIGSSYVNCGKVASSDNVDSHIYDVLRIEEV